MKIIIAILLVLLLYFQFKLWIGDGGVPDVMHLQKEVDAAKLEKERLQERNQALAAEVNDLKQGQEAVEERARNELGMIKQGETFYQIINPAADKNTTSKNTKSDNENSNFSTGSPTK